MTLQEFIKKFDRKDSIVLLEGKRKVSEDDKYKLIALGKLLMENTEKMIFRSGNAEGADYYFSIGVASVSNSRLQFITPYNKHRQKSNLAGETFSLDGIDILSEPKVIQESKKKLDYKWLVDDYVKGERNRYAIKAAYIIRDTIKAIGTSDIKPATFGIFYNDLKKPLSGGTGHTMNICNQNNIPVIDQTVWFNWLKRSDS